MRRTFPLVSPILFAAIVAILGFISPGYSHINHTISRLAIEKYGWIQALNMLQLSWAVYLTGIGFTDRLHDWYSIRVIRTIFIICAVFLVIAAFFPTDPIENVPLDLTIISPTGLVHISVVVLFLILSPFGIIKISKILAKEAAFRRFARYTLIAGFAAIVGSVVWFTLYFSGMYLGYRGIFQKAIASPVLLWLILINYALAQNQKDEPRPES